MVKRSEIQKGIRVILNENFKVKSLSDQYLSEEPAIFIADGHIYNSIDGDYIFIKGGSCINSGIAYLTEIDIEFPFPETPLYLPDVNCYNDYINSEIEKLKAKLNKIKQIKN